MSTSMDSPKSMTSDVSDISSSRDSETTITTTTYLEHMHQGPSAIPNSEPNPWPTLRSLVQSSTPLPRPRTQWYIPSAALTTETPVTSGLPTSRPWTPPLTPQGQLPVMATREIIATRMHGAWHTMPRGIFSRSHLGAIGERLVPLGNIHSGPVVASVYSTAPQSPLTPVRQSNAAPGSGLTAVSSPRTEFYRQVRVLGKMSDSALAARRIERRLASEASWSRQANITVSDSE